MMCCFVDCVAGILNILAKYAQRIDIHRPSKQFQHIFTNVYLVIHMLVMASVRRGGGSVISKVGHAATNNPASSTSSSSGIAVEVLLASALISAERFQIFASSTLESG